MSARGEARLDAHADVTRVDMHVKVLDEDVVKRAKAEGLDALVYAPHFTRLPAIQARAEAFADDDLTIIPAREVFTGDWQTRRHVLAIGLDDPVPDFITLDAAFEEFDRQDAAVLAPHPAFANVSLSLSDVHSFSDDIDAVETYNAKCLPYQNRRGQRIARETGIPAFGSSYAHLRRTIGEAWTEFEGDIDSTADLVDALKSPRRRRVVRRSGTVHRLRRAAEFGHLAYENTWEKVDRLLLSGMEPTHPDHIAYDGRFDDVSVY